MKAVSNQGILKVKFSSAIQFTDDLIDRINEQRNKTATNESKNQTERTLKSSTSSKPFISIRTEAGIESEPEDLGFNWTISALTPRQLEVHLNFTKPGKISMNREADAVIVTLNLQEFTDAYG